MPGRNSPPQKNGDFGRHVDEGRPHEEGRRPEHQEEEWVPQDGLPQESSVLVERRPLKIPSAPSSRSASATPSLQTSPALKSFPLMVRWKVASGKIPRLSRENHRDRPAEPLGVSDHRGDRGQRAHRRWGGHARADQGDVKVGGRVLVPAERRARVRDRPRTWS